MKITTDTLKVALQWVEKNWVRDQSYNLTMTKASKSTAPAWAQQLIKDVKELKEDVVVLKEFVVEQKAFNAQVFEFMKEQREFNKRTDDRLEKIEQDIKDIKSCPTIKKELKILAKQ